MHTRISEVSDESIRSLLTELEQTTGKSVEAHSSMSVFSFLQLCQKDSLGFEKSKIKAKDFYKGSMLKTRVGEIQEDSVYLLAKKLCANFQVHHGLAMNRQLYVFLNEIFNPKSQLRKPPPLRL